MRATRSARYSLLPKRSLLSTTARSVRYWHIPIASTPEAQVRQKAFFSFLERQPNVRTQPYRTKSKEETKLSASTISARDVQRLLNITLELEAYEDMDQFCATPEKKVKELPSQAQALLVPELDFPAPTVHAREHLWELQKRTWQYGTQEFLKELEVVTEDVVRMGRRRQKGQVESFSVGLALEMLRGVGCGRGNLSWTLNMQRDRKNRFKTHLVVHDKKYSLMAKPDIIVWRDDPVDDEAITIVATSSVAVRSAGGNDDLASCIVELVTTACWNSDPDSDVRAATKDAPHQSTGHYCTGPPRDIPP